jgi:hypothetical protein
MKYSSTKHVEGGYSMWLIENDQGVFMRVFHQGVTMFIPVSLVDKFKEFEWEKDSIQSKRNY